MIQLWQYIVSAVTVCVLWLWLWERRVRKRFAGSLSTSLRPLPFIGNIHQIGGDSKELFRLILRITELCDQTESGRLVVWLGPRPILVTHDPEDVRTITNSFLEKPYFYNFGKIWLGDGLVTAPVPTWKHNIKKLSGTFSMSIVNGYLGVFNAQAHKLVEQLKMEDCKEPFNIMHKYLALVTLEAICQTALGMSDISESIVTTEYYEAFDRCLELLITRGLNVVMHLDFIYKLTSSYQEMKKSVAVMHNVSHTVMRNKKREREKQKKDENTKYEEHDELKLKSFLDILLDMHEIDPSLTEQQMQFEVDTIMVGGQETVATTMYFAFLMLGCKKRIQDKLYAELKAIFGHSNRPVTKDDLSQMKYLEAVILETLRLYPPLPVVMRYADRDLKLQSLTIPKGTMCGLNGWGAGRSARIWGTDATLFRPERWLQDQPPGYAASFLAFSYGRRACIGKKYAMTILKTVIAHCVRELEFISEAEKMELKLDIRLQPISGHLIQVRRRSCK